MIINVKEYFPIIKKYYFRDRANIKYGTIEHNLYCDKELTYQEYCLIRNVEIFNGLFKESFDTSEMYSLEFEYNTFCIASLFNEIIVDKPWDKVLINRTKLSVGKEPLEKLNWQYRSPYKEMLAEKGIVFPKSNRLHSICCNYYRLVDDYNFDLDPDLTYEEYEIIRQMRYDTNNDDKTISLYQMHDFYHEWMTNTVAHFNQPALFTKPFLEAIIDKNKHDFTQIKNYKEVEPYKQLFEKEEERRKRVIRYDINEEL